MTGPSMPGNDIGEPLRALVIGCGAAGSGYDRRATAQRPPLSHAGAYVAHPRTELVAGIDVSERARTEFQERWGVPTYAAVAGAFEVGRCDVVSVCTPPATRESIVAEVVTGRPRAIWCEKPLASSYPEAQALVARCEAAGVALQVNFLRRFDPVHRKLRDELDSISHMDVRYDGSLLNYGIHALDLVRWFAGEAVWLQAIGVDARLLDVIMETRSGATASLAQVSTGEVDLFDVDLYASDCRVALTALGEELLRARPRCSALFDNVSRFEFDGEVTRGGLAHAMHEGVGSIAAHLDAGTPLLCDGQDGVAAMRLHDAILRSLEIGEPVRFEAACEAR